ncbi:MAG: tetratricopeptide repeat protein [Pseudomonadota bacterium]
MTAAQRDFLVSLAYLFLYHQAFDKAAVLYAALRVLAPEDRAIGQALGYCWLRQGNPAKALTLLDELGDDAPEDATAQSLRAECLVALGRLSEAQALWEKP